MIDIVQSKLADLARRACQYHVRRLELFGSAASGNEYDAATSDLDFLVEFEPLLPGQHADAYFGLLEALQDLFGRPIDLLETKAIHNPYLLETINRDRTVLYAA